MPTPLPRDRVHRRSPRHMLHRDHETVRRSQRLAGMLVASALASLLVLAGCDRQPGGGDTRTAAVSAAPASAPVSPFKGTDITGADYARKFSMTDVDGKRRSLDDFKGKVTVVFFGYTQCPDVCPTTMAELAEAKRKLGQDGQRVQGVFVTLDPDRDSAALLKSYVSNFDPTFVALRGDIVETKDLAREFKVFFVNVPGKTDKSYTVDHTTGSYLFDTQGRVRVFAKYGGSPQVLIDDLKVLLAEKG